MSRRSLAPPYNGAVKTEQTTDKRDGMSVTTLVLGLVVLVALLTIGGFGIGVPELVVWFALVVAWVALWRSKRRRPQVIVIPPSTGSVWPVM